MNSAESLFRAGGVSVPNVLIGEKKDGLSIAASDGRISF